jgi:hypothetical protein
MPSPSSEGAAGKEMRQVEEQGAVLGSAAQAFGAALHEHVGGLRRHGPSSRMRVQGLIEDLAVLGQEAPKRWKLAGGAVELARLAGLCNSLDQQCGGIGKHDGLWQA